MAETILIVFGSAVLVMLGIIMRQLHKQHLAMNSKFDELLSTTGKLRHAEGFRAGQEDHLAAIRDWKE